MQWSSSRFRHAGRSYHAKRQTNNTDSSLPDVSTDSTPSSTNAYSTVSFRKDGQFSSMVTSTITLHHEFTTQTTFTEYTTQTAAASEASATTNPSPSSGLTIHSRDGIIITVLATLAGILFMFCFVLLVKRCMRRTDEEEPQGVPHPVSFHHTYISSGRTSAQSRFTDSSSGFNSKGRRSPRDDALSPHTMTPTSPQASISHPSLDMTAGTGVCSSSFSHHPQAGSISSEQTLAEAPTRKELPIGFHRPRCRLAISSPTRATASEEGTIDSRLSRLRHAMQFEPPPYTPESPMTPIPARRQS